MPTYLQGLTSDSTELDNNILVNLIGFIIHHYSNIRPENPKGWSILKDNLQSDYEGNLAFPQVLQQKTTVWITKRTDHSHPEGPVASPLSGDRFLVQQKKDT